MKSSRDDSRTLTAFAALLTGNLILVANKRGRKRFPPPVVVAAVVLISCLISRSLSSVV